jgi:hypothetical protein
MEVPQDLFNAREGDVSVGAVAALLHGLFELGILGEPVADGGEATSDRPARSSLVAPNKQNL